MATVRPLVFPARSTMVVRHLETSPPTPASVKSRQSVWIECSAGTIGTDMACVVVAIGENCDLMYGLRCGASCPVSTPSKPWRLAVTTLKPFSFPMEKVGTIPIAGESSLQCLQEAGAPGPRNPR